MLACTFIHLPGISERRERELWRAGIWTWGDLHKAFPVLKQVHQPTLFPEFEASNSSKRETLQEAVESSIEALEVGNADFFAERLKPSEHYRIAQTFKTETAFLDIETTGLSHYYDQITVVGVSIGDEYFAWIKGTNDRDFLEFIERAKCLVTFNGKIFDLRFIKKDWPKLVLPKAHVDLRFFSKKVGLSGGQKAIEKELGISRDEDVEGVVGERAPTLWHEYRMGDLDALKTLVIYNHADVEGMKGILDEATRRVFQQEPVLQEFNQHPFSEDASYVKWAHSPKTKRKNHVYLTEFRGKRGPLVAYKDLRIPNRSEFIVVGIDLTGSEARPTGWCLLKGNEAVTKTLSTDADLLEETLNAQPNLISIDSPLSLPHGRTRVEDDDPKRDEIGIMRYCERVLKSRGVNVYPSLIPSMQKLTARGIRLADRFRKLGLPVIESYPGAAQDIMNIPRKRDGLEYLVKGLHDFGIRGAFVREKVSHDELDAITSAVVGLFFWSGRFEALGNDDEEYLIIPDLEQDTKEWFSRMVVGISGQIAAGKTTAARHLEKSSMAYARFSEVLADELEAEGKPVNRGTLQEIGSRIRETLGQRWLEKKLLERVKNSEHIVFDGLRFVEDRAFFIETFGPRFAHFHIEASKEVRKLRYVETGKSAEEFDKAESHLVEIESQSLSKFADEIIENVENKQGFLSKVTRAIKRKNKNLF